MTGSDQDLALLEEGLPIVQAAVRTYAGRFRGVASDELRSAAHEALVVAIRRYDRTKGAFADFAKRSIYGAVIDAAFQAHGWRRRGLDLIRGIQAKTTLAQEGPAKTMSEMMAEPEDPQRSVRDVIRSRAVAFASALVAGDPPHQEDALLERETYARGVRALREGLERLEPRDRRVIEGLYWQGKTHVELAVELDTSTKTVQRSAYRAKLALHDALVAAGVRAAPEPMDVG